ncbi:MAG: Do family serine endopeptidase [Spirochaetaceae bacterium]|jgi:Do/DeqQ family serine protease|nr:Do family serine endopeptidase [Spirochaetaceae bacterium]
MKTIPSSKTIGTFALIFFSVIMGFVASFFILRADNGNNEINSVYAESENDGNLSGALALQNTYRKVSSDVLPVVVEIEAVEYSTQESQTIVNPFNFFFGPNGNNENKNNNEDEKDKQVEPEKFRNSGLGSGILVRHEDKKYYVLTNNHVAGKADEIMIKLFDERSYQGVLVGTDERKDLALVSFETNEDLEIGVLGDSDTLYVGDFVLAIGNPFGFQSTVTSGIISALGRHQGPDNNISDFIQTDASINQGNSGGALVNLRGEIIGINTWITTPTGGSIGLGFSIPINNAKKAINDIMSTGSPEYGWLGVSIGDISSDSAESLGVESTVGAFVSQVFKNSPADKGGIKPGDIVVTIDGVNIKNKNDLLYMVGDIAPGTRVTFNLIRNNRPITATVKIEKRESEDKVEELSLGNTIWPGVSLLPLNDEFRKRLSIDDNINGVVIFEVYPKTPLQIAGLKSGDLIIEINGTTVADLNDFYRLLDSSNKINFTYIREGVTLETSSIVNR